MIEGIIIVSLWNNFVCLESDLVIWVVVCCDLNKNNVVVIFGGGVGYELVYVGFIGKGMLIVVVCGDLFVLLSVDVVFIVI